MGRVKVEKGLTTTGNNPETAYNMSTPILLATLVTWSTQIQGRLGNVVFLPRSHVSLVLKGEGILGDSRGLCSTFTASLVLGLHIYVRAELLCPPSFLPLVLRSLPDHHCSSLD